MADVSVPQRTHDPFPLAAGIRNGGRAASARAITLFESKRADPRTVRIGGPSATPKRRTE
ncbi:MAG TPA: hypothetical protein VHT93_17885 [Pseudolabrys sp.]|nr:hypothetical protein [Pseudolabrys sp.]